MRHVAAFRFCLMALGCGAIAVSCFGGASSRPMAPEAKATAEARIRATMARSAELFDAKLAFRIRYTIDASDQGIAIEGDGVYAPPATALYARMALVGDNAADDEVVAQLLMASDLYLQRGDGSWLVQSPWNVGTALGEIPDDDPNEPPIDYPAVVRAMDEAKAVSNNDGADAGLLGFRGRLHVSRLLRLVGPGATGAATIEVWIDEATELPTRMVITLDRDRTFRSEFQFDGYDEEVSYPAFPVGAQPIRDAQFPDAPCRGDELERCLHAPSEAVGADSCGGTEKRVCILPLGNVPGEQLGGMVAYFRDAYGLDVEVLKPAAIPAEFVEPKRGQIADDALFGYMEQLYPNDYANTQVILIGLTTIDIHMVSKHYRYVFGVRLTDENPKGVISLARLDPRFYGEPPDGELFSARARTMLSKYVGFLYYRLPPSSDRSSAMFDAIGGPSDVDGMTDPLDVSTR